MENGCLLLTIKAILYKQTQFLTIKTKVVSDRTVLEVQLTFRSIEIFEIRWSSYF